MCLFPSNVLFFSIFSFNKSFSISTILEKVRKKWIFLFLQFNLVKCLYQFLFNDHVYSTSNVLIPFFYSTLSSTYQCLFMISCHFYLLLLSKFTIIQLLIMFFSILDHVPFFQFISTSIYFNSSASYQFVLIINLFFFFIQFCSIFIRLLFSQSSVSLMAFWHICSIKGLVDTFLLCNLLVSEFPTDICLLGSL